MSFTANFLNFSAQLGKLRAKYLKKHEAIKVLREICYLISDASIVNISVLKSADESAAFASKGYSLQMKVAVSESALESIKSIVAKYRLSARESGDYLVIYTPHRIVEILA
jgi:hypothetical protein